MSLFEPETTDRTPPQLARWQAQWGELGQVVAPDLPDAAIQGLLCAVAEDTHTTYGLAALPVLHKALTAMVLSDDDSRPLRWVIPLADRVVHIELTVEPEDSAQGDGEGGGLELMLDEALLDLALASEADLAQWPALAVRDAHAMLQARWPTAAPYECWLPLALGALAWQRMQAERLSQRIQVLDGIPWAGQTYASTLTVREAPRREAVVLTSTRWGQRA